MEDEDGSECLLSFIAQLNPSGWIWETCGYQQAFLKEVRVVVSFLCFGVCMLIFMYFSPSSDIGPRFVSFLLLHIN